MKKYLIAVGFILLSFALIVSAVLFKVNYNTLQSLAHRNLGGVSGEASYSQASTTAWTIGPQNSTTVLNARANRGCIILSNNGLRNIYYRFDATAATQDNGILLTGSSTIIYSESVPYRGVVTAFSSVASTTLLVTECTY